MHKQYISVKIDIISGKIKYQETKTSIKRRKSNLIKKDLFFRTTQAKTLVEIGVIDPELHLYIIDTRACYTNMLKVGYFDSNSPIKRF